MQRTLIVSNRGQLTLSANLRKRFGIRNGGAVIIEDRDNEMVIKPAAVLEIEMYSAEQVAAWDEEDLFSPADRAAVLAKLSQQP
jgi:antitoxin PrlF